jgi:hypothetical protein
LFRKKFLKQKHKHGGDSSIEEKIPQSRKTQARDEAGKTAGAASNCNLLATSGSYQTIETDKDMLWK